MYGRYLKNDVRRSWLITVTTALFVAAAAMLVALASVLAVNLTGSIDHLMTQGKTPHFLQMHSGSYDALQLDAFAQGNDNVAQYQVMEFLNVDGIYIRIGENSLTDSLLDNGFSVQSELFDYLLNIENETVYPEEGEIYVPISYMKDGTAKLGDIVIVGDTRFAVAGFLRDSQMNSNLASSKRFLVSESDFEKLISIGKMEYLIEFRLRDLSQIGAFETAYVNAGIASNGPAITYSQFRLINALSDGLMIAVILLISVLVVAISFMCIRFTLLAKIEDDYREIGVMKAIGLRVSDIKRLYLIKYAAVAAAGSVLGYGLSFLFRDMLLENIRLYMGESSDAGLAQVFGIVGVLLVFGVNVLYVNRVLRQFKKISAADAVRFGVEQEKQTAGKRSVLAKKHLLGLNVVLGINDVLRRKRLYVTMLVVLVLCVFIFLLPQNVHSTISSPNFIRYMGIGEIDILIGVQQIDDISGKSQEIADALNEDPAIDTYTVRTTKALSVRMQDGSLENIRIELGDHTVFPIQYSSGGAPIADNEIALSAINADDLGMRVGDSLVIMTSQGEQAMTVCGIYSDITNGGKTAKAAFVDESAEIMWSSINVTLVSSTLMDKVVMEYSQRFPFARAADIAEYMDQTFGGTVESVGLAANVAAVIAPVIAFLITLLFMRMLVAKEHYPIAVMKALGFTSRDIQRQFLARGVFLLILSLVFGTLLVSTLGEALAGALISMLGVTSFRMSDNGMATYLFSPLVIGLTTLAGVVLASFRVSGIKISENVKE